MAPNQGSGKIICVFGPPFSGKTYLINHLIDWMDGLITINFELFYKTYDRARECYQAFYNYAYDQMGSRPVILDSVYNRINNSEYNHNIPVSHYAILCWPDEKAHKDRFDCFMYALGEEWAYRRTGGLSIKDMRDAFSSRYRRSPTDWHILYDGTNIDAVKEGIKNYVSS